MNGKHLAAVVLGGVLACTGLARAPRAQVTTPQRPQLGADGLPVLGPEVPAAQREKQEKLQNDDRQKQLIADTDKLLQLATELHTEVAKTDKNTLSLDVIKKAEEIEKLAHSVKVKMRG